MEGGKHVLVINVLRNQSELSESLLIILQVGQGDFKYTTL